MLSRYLFFTFIKPHNTVLQATHILFKLHNLTAQLNRKNDLEFLKSSLTFGDPNIFI